MRLFVTLIAVFFCWISSFTQSANDKEVLIKVLTETRSYLPDAIVTLLAQDSSVIKSTTPQGEAGAGISKQILKNTGTLRLNIRDIFYTQNYSGYSKFQNSDEPFEVKWDSRVIRLTFNWRFGKAMKAIKRSGGGSDDETNRVGN